MVAILAALIHSVKVGKEMSRLLRPDKLAVVGLEGDGPVLEPVEVEQGCVGSSSLSCLETSASLQTEQEKLKALLNCFKADDVVGVHLKYLSCMVLIAHLAAFGSNSNWKVSWLLISSWFAVTSTPATSQVCHHFVSHQVLSLKR